MGSSEPALVYSAGSIPCSPLRIQTLKTKQTSFFLKLPLVPDILVRILSFLSQGLQCQCWCQCTVLWYRTVYVASPQMPKGLDQLRHLLCKQSSQS